MADPTQAPTPAPTLPPLPAPPPANAPYETHLAYESLRLRRASTEAELAANASATAAVLDGAAATREHITMGQSLLDKPDHELFWEAMLAQIGNDPYGVMRQTKGIGEFANWSAAAVLELRRRYPNATPAAQVPPQAA